MTSPAKAGLFRAGGHSIPPLAELNDPIGMRLARPGAESLFPPNSVHANR